MKRVTVIAPMYNEEDSIPFLESTLGRLAERLSPEYELECVLVDDGSKDGTCEAVRKYFSSWKTMILVKHPVNRGPGAAMRSGFARATGDFVCTIDSDCTFDPLCIPTMLEMLDTLKVDIITASPYHPQGGVENVPPWRLLLSRGASTVYRFVSASKLYTYTSFMRVYRRRVIDTVSFTGDGFAAFTEVLLRASHQGYKIGELPAVLKSRANGVSKMRVLSTMRKHMTLMGRAFLWRFSEPRHDSALPGRASAKHL